MGLGFRLSAAVGIHCLVILWLVSLAILDRCWLVFDFLVGFLLSSACAVGWVLSVVCWWIVSRSLGFPGGGFCLGVVVWWVLGLLDSGISCGVVEI